MDVLEELAAYARSHKMLAAGHGSTDDVLGFIDWYRAAAGEHVLTNDCWCNPEVIKVPATKR